MANGSKPSRNHHYIPQTHIKNFIDLSGEYTLYRKSTNDFVTPTNSKSFFYEKDLNTTVNQNNLEIDFESIEKDLKSTYDDKFQFHFNFLIEWIANTIEKGMNSDVCLKETIDFFRIYSISTLFRSKMCVSSYKEDIFETFDFFLNHVESLNLDKFQIEQLRQYVDKMKELKYPAISNFEQSFISDFLPQDYSCDIILSLECDFILPDCCTILDVSKEKHKVNGFTTNKINAFGFPVSPKIYLQFKDNKNAEVKTNEIYLIGVEKVFALNKKLLESANNLVLFTKDPPLIKV